MVTCDVVVMVTCDAQGYDVVVVMVMCDVVTCDVQGYRRGTEQDQDVRPAEGHTSQRTTQGHHPGRG